MATKINTISNALLMIGDKTINSLDEGSFRATVASNLYDNTYETVLISHPWGFARKIEALALTADTSVIETWTKIYQKPSDLISILRVYPRTDYEIYGDKIYSNASDLKLDYISRIQESMWPNYFARLMEVALAKEFAIPLREDANMASLLEQRFVGQGQKARAVESKERIQRPIMSRPLIEARYQ